jgi:hypothetical protein
MLPSRHIDLKSIFLTTEKKKNLWIICIQFSRYKNRLKAGKLVGYKIIHENIHNRQPILKGTIQKHLFCINYWLAAI